MTIEIAKYPPPFSLRLTFEERARLEKEAAGMALGAYIRLKGTSNNTPIGRGWSESRTQRGFSGPVPHRRGYLLG